MSNVHHLAGSPSRKSSAITPKKNTRQKKSTRTPPHNTQQVASPFASSPPPVEEIVEFVSSLKRSQQDRNATIPILEQVEAPAANTPDTPTNGTQQPPPTHRKQLHTRRRASTPLPPHSSQGEEQSLSPTETHQPQVQPSTPKQPLSSHKHTHAVHQQPRRTFIAPDLAHLPEIPNECIPLIERVERSLREELAVEAGATIVVAVSGGVDSVTLLDILFILSYEHGYALHIAHVNHRLRGQESDRDETFVRSLAKRYDLPCHITHSETESFARKHRLSIEEAARELRYRFLRQTCGTVHAQYCAVAHTADDTAETLLLNLFRGTGLTGLAGIPPKRALTKKAQLIRPLLGITREEILLYAKTRPLEWIEDITNADLAYRRNRVRQKILPTLKEHFNPRIIETLARTAEILRQADGFIESLIESTYQQIVRAYDGRVEIDRAQLAPLHPFIRGEIIERAIGELTERQAVSHAAVERVASLLTAPVGTRQSILGSIIALADRDHVVISDQASLQSIYLPIFKLGTYSIGRYTITLEEVDRNSVRLGTDPTVEYFDYELLPYRLFLRTWQAGDRFAPIGMKGAHVLVADYLTNAKVSEYERRTAVVLATADDIVWLCGYRMSEHFKLTDETRRIIRATFHRS